MFVENANDNYYMEKKPVIPNERPATADDIRKW